MDINVCETNKHWRKEHSRTLRSGEVITVSGGCVADPGYGTRSSPIKQRSCPVKSRPVTVPKQVNRVDLSQYGYNPRSSKYERYEALDAAARDLSALSVLRYLTDQAAKKVSDDAFTLNWDLAHLDILTHLSAPELGTGRMIPYAWDLPTNTRHKILDHALHNHGYDITKSGLIALSQDWDNQATHSITSDINYINNLAT